MKYFRFQDCLINLDDISTVGPKGKNVILQLRGGQFQEIIFNNSQNVQDMINLIEKALIKREEEFDA